MKKQRAKAKTVRKEPVGFTRKQRNEIFEIVSHAVREPLFKLDRDVHILRKEMHHEIGSLRTEVGQEIGSLRTEVGQRFSKLEADIKQVEEKLKSYIAVQVESLKYDFKAVAEKTTFNSQKLEDHETRIGRLELRP